MLPNLLLLARGLTTDRIGADIAASVEWLRNQPPKTEIAIAGFCMGGKMALHRARGFKNVFKAAAIWYGALPDFEPEDVKLPVVGSFGADNHGIPVDQGNLFSNRLAVGRDIKVYAEAGRPFADTTHSSYVAKAVEDSWERTIRFLRETMSGAGNS